MRLELPRVLQSVANLLKGRLQSTRWVLGAGARCWVPGGGGWVCLPACQPASQPNGTCSGGTSAPCLCIGFFSESRSDLQGRLRGSRSFPRLPSLRAARAMAHDTRLRRSVLTHHACTHGPCHACAHHHADPPCMCPCSDDARAVLVSMARELGADYLPFVCDVLRSALPLKGYLAQASPTFSPSSLSVHCFLAAHSRGSILSAE